MEIAQLILGLVEKLLPLAMDAWKAKDASSDEIKARLVTALAEAQALIAGLPVQLAANDSAADAAAKAKG